MQQPGSPKIYEGDAEKNLAFEIEKILSENNTELRCVFGPVWPDWERFRHLGKKFKTVQNED
jgi:hypothetical protein